MQDAARLAMERYEGSLPADFDILTSIKGIGPKCANLVLGIAGKQQAISVDIHVHRVTNRWGIIATATPEQSMKQLESIIPTSIGSTLTGY
jgi:endonuclease-3